MALTALKPSNFHAQRVCLLAILSISCLFNVVVSISILAERLLLKYGIIPDVIDAAPDFTIDFSLYIFGTREYLRRRDLTMIRIRFKFTGNCLRCYFPFVISIIVCLFKIVISATNNIDHTLRYHGIIPDIIDVAPKFVINISYKRNDSLRMGFKVDPGGMQHVPWVEWPVEAGAFYTLLMIDPDIPVAVGKKPAQRQHWIVGNIPGWNFRRGETITGYMGPMSPKYEENLCADFLKILIDIEALTVVCNVAIEGNKLLFRWNHRYLSSFTAGVTYNYLTTGVNMLQLRRIEGASNCEDVLTALPTLNGGTKA
nr:PREDICTED: uncharacterized protein LOC109042862 isoform X2 [Bemisia tabaci]